MTLLALVSRTLDSRGVAHAVIGATALAVHGVSRATADIDLLATDPACLDPALWAEVAATGARSDIRRGDVDDPLAGVVRKVPGEGHPNGRMNSRWADCIGAEIERRGWAVRP